MKTTINNYKKIIKSLGFEPLKNQQISLHYARQKTNQMQISYITEKKIHGVLENVGISVSPTNKEHRAKFFLATKPAKFFNTLVNENKLEHNLVSALRDKFIQDFQASVTLSVKLYAADTIPTFYNMQKDQINDNGKTTFLSSRMSCMQGKPKSYFEVYAKTEALRIAILEDGSGNMYGRALLWSAQDEFYLDRVYIADALSGSDDVRAVYQHKLWDKVCTQINKTINCYSAPHFKDLIKQDDVSAKPPTPEQPYTTFNPKLAEGVDALEFEYYPYADTFQGIDSGEWSADECSGEVYLCNTDGSNANDESCTCDECGDRVDENYICYSEYDAANYCEDCATYCEDHETYILCSDAVNNTHTGTTHHRDDLSNY